MPGDAPASPSGKQPHGGLQLPETPGRDAAGGGQPRWPGPPRRPPSSPRRQQLWGLGCARSGPGLSHRTGPSVRSSGWRARWSRVGRKASVCRRRVNSARSQVHQCLENESVRGPPRWCRRGSPAPGLIGPLGTLPNYTGPRPDRVQRPSTAPPHPALDLNMGTPA